MKGCGGGEANWPGQEYQDENGSRVKRAEKQNGPLAICKRGILVFTLMPCCYYFVFRLRNVVFLAIVNSEIDLGVTDSGKSNLEISP